VLEVIIAALDAVDDAEDAQNVRTRRGGGRVWDSPLTTLQCMNGMEERCLHNRACTHSLVEIAQLTCQKSALLLTTVHLTLTGGGVHSVERSLQRLFRWMVTMDRAFLPRTVDRAFLPRTTTAIVAMLVGRGCDVCEWAQPPMRGRFVMRGHCDTRSRVRDLGDV
jgi:hypothetical protein